MNFLKLKVFMDENEVTLSELRSTSWWGRFCWRGRSSRPPHQEQSRLCALSRGKRRAEKAVKSFEAGTTTAVLQFNSRRTAIHIVIVRRTVTVFFACSKQWLNN